MGLSQTFENIKYRLTVDRTYLYILLGFLGFIILLLGYLMFRPKAPTIPVLPSGGLRNGLVTYWGFDEKSGQLLFNAVAHGQRHNGRLGFSRGSDPADPARTGRGKRVRALRLDGRDDYAIVLDHPDLRPTKEITMAGWFRAQGASQPASPVWLSGFSFRRQIVVDNTNSRQNFSDFQLQIAADTAELILQGKLKPDCSDLRFTNSDETTSLFYWLESGCNTTKTKIWVRVPELFGQSAKSLYFYYGNTQAESQSDFYQAMEAKPIVWWQYPEPELEGKKLNGIAVDFDNNILVVGSDEEERDLQWRQEIIPPTGALTAHRQIIFRQDFSAGADEINAVATDSRGETILAGYDSEPGNSRWRAVKRNDWGFAADFSSGSDEIKAAAVDREGNVILAGYDSSAKGPTGNTQWRVVKLNSEGQRLWDYTANLSDQDDAITAMAIDSRNNIILAGFEKSLGHDRWLVEKLDPAKNTVFLYKLDISSGADVPNAVVVDSSDNIIIVGYDFFQGNAQWRLLKLDSWGNRLWQWNWNPSSGFDEATAVAVDSHDNIIVAGYDASPGDFQWTLHKFSPEGQKIWEWTLNPSTGFDEIKALAVDYDDNIIFAGTDHSLRIDPLWRVVKLSEKKPISRQPGIEFGGESRETLLPPGIILAKPGSWQVNVQSGQLVGVINRSLITTSLRGNDWQHFVMTFDGSKQKLYLNSALVNSVALTSEIAVNTNNVFLGYNFPGLLDELMIYNRALTPEEVRGLYNRR